MKLYVSLPVSILREKNRYIAYTTALDLSTSGRTYQEVKRRFGEAVNIFFEELEKMGTLDEVLQNLGWRKMQKQWQPPVVVSHESEIVRVPV